MRPIRDGPRPNAGYSLGVDSDFYPPMWAAGTEEDPDVSPQRIQMPVHAEARELWRMLQTEGQPFTLTVAFDPSMGS